MEFIKNENYFITYGWMLNMNLSRTERDIFAIIYGFSQAEQRCYASLSYFVEWTGTTKKTVITAIKKLESKKIIKVFREIGESNSYFPLVNASDFYENDSENLSNYHLKQCKNCTYNTDVVVENLQQPVKKLHSNQCKNCSSDSVKTTPNNIYNNISDNIINNIYTPPTKKLEKKSETQNQAQSKKLTFSESNKKQKTEVKNKDLEKHKYGEYKNVLLTDSEYKKLSEKLKNDVDAVINNFDELLEMKGYKYKSHYLAILKWGINAFEEQKRKGKKGMSAWDLDNSGIKLDYTEPAPF